MTRTNASASQGAARTLIRIWLLLLTATIGACDEGPPSENPTVRPWESYVRAAERFVRMHFEYDRLLLRDGERYAAAVIAGDHLSSEHFHAVLRNKPRTFKPSYLFEKAPEGAYLSEQDKKYLERIEEQLMATRAASYKEAMERLEALHAAKREKGAEKAPPLPQALLSDFMEMPAFVKAVREIGEHDLKEYVEALLAGLHAQGVDRVAIDAMLRRPPEYKTLYEKHREAFISAGLEAGEKYLKRRSGPRAVEAGIQQDLTVFLGSEVFYGLEGNVSAGLDARGFYAALGRGDRSEFQKRLRAALKAAAEKGS